MSEDHGSTAFLHVIRAVGVVVAVVGLAAGCVTSETRVRVVSRAGALRGVVVSANVPDAPISIVAGADVLTDAELTALQNALPKRVRDGVADEGQYERDDGGPFGQVQAVRVRVKAAPGRERHRTVVACRLRLKVGEDVVADVEGTTVRLVQARNLSVVELDGIREEMARNGGRNPLLAAEDTENAVVEACTAALNAIIREHLPGDVEVDRANGAGFAEKARRAERADRRRRAVARLEAELLKSPRRHDVVAASLVDIGEAGIVADAVPVARFLHDDNSLVRRAAASAFSSLCAGHAGLGVDAATCVRPPPPAPPAPPAPLQTTPAPVAPLTPEQLERRPEGADDEADAPNPLPTLLPPLLPPPAPAPMTIQATPPDEAR